MNMCVCKCYVNNKKWNRRSSYMPIHMITCLDMLLKNSFAKDF